MFPGWGLAHAAKSGRVACDFPLPKSERANARVRRELNLAAATSRLHTTGAHLTNQVRLSFGTGDAGVHINLVDCTEHSGHPTASIKCDLFFIIRAHMPPKGNRAGGNLYLQSAKGREMARAEKTGNAPPQIFIRIINPQLQLRSRLLLTQTLLFSHLPLLLKRSLIKAKTSLQMKPPRINTLNNITVNYITVNNITVNGNRAFGNSSREKENWRSIST
jgi:hypothetical protein